MLIADVSINLSCIKIFSDAKNRLVLDFFELARERAPDIFIGLDFVGYEDQMPMSHCCGLIASHFADKPKPALMLHAGESAKRANDSCSVAVANGSRRLGHALGLMLDQETLRTVREEKVLVEANPVSNWILGYVLDMRWHPARFYPAMGVKVRWGSEGVGNR